MNPDVNLARGEFRILLVLGLALAFIGSVAHSRADRLLDDLVSYWPLDVVEGNRTPDEISSYDLDLVNLTADDLVDGYAGKAMAFDHARQTLLVRIHEPWEDLPANQHSAFTISMWVQVAGAGQNNLRIFSEGSTEDRDPLFNIGTRVDGESGQVDFYIRNEGPGWPTVYHIRSEQEALDGTWRHIAFTQMADGTRLLHVDGVLDSVTIGPSRPGEGDYPLNTTSVGGIRRAGPSGPSHWVTGNIDEVAIWKRALSEEEINRVIAEGVPLLLSSGLVSHWPLDEVAGARTPDVVSGYDLDLVNLTAGDLIEGYSGLAMAFDKARQTLLVRIHEPGELLPINQNPAFTISMWVQVVGTGQYGQRIFSEGNTEDSNPLFGIGTRVDGTSDQVAFYIRNDGSDWPTVGHIRSEQEALDGTWRHIAFTQMDDGTRLLHVDGVLDGLEIGLRPEEGGWALDTTSVGGVRSIGAAHGVTGNIDEVALWRRALSEEEIGQVFESGVPSVPTGSSALEIASFTVEYPAVVNGQNAVLHWDATPEALLSINHGVGDVMDATEFGVGSIEVTMDGSRNFVLTARRGTESVTASILVRAFWGVTEGWALIDNFDTWELGSIDGKGLWRNPVGSAHVVEGPRSQALTFLAGEALNALDLMSRTIPEGARTTLFFRTFVDPESDADGLALNVGLTDKPIRFVDDFDSDVGPFVHFSNSEGFGVDLYARNGSGVDLEWLGRPALDEDRVCNVWIDIKNRSVEDGDLFTIHVQKEGEERITTAARQWVSDRNPAGSSEPDAVFPDLDVLFTAAFAGSRSAGLVQFDDFYLSTTGDFNDTIPVPVQETVFLQEVDPPAEDGAISINQADGVVTLEYTGTLHVGDSVTGPFAPVVGAGSPYQLTVETGAVRFFIVR